MTSGFKSYKIRDGVHIPSEKYKENWNAIFGKKKKPTKGLDGELETKIQDNSVPAKNKNSKTV